MEMTLALVSPRLLVRVAIRCLLESRGVLVVGEAATAADARALIAAERPHVVLIEFDPATDAILPALPELLSASARTRALLVTASRDAGIHQQAVELGAAGVVLTEQAPDLLVKAIHKVHAGEVWLDRSLTAGVLSRLTRSHTAVDPELVKIQSLTRREREIVGLIGEGLKNRQIGERLFISEATVRNHLTSILDKFDLGDRFELAVYAFRHGLVAYPQRYPQRVPLAAAGVAR